MSENRVQFNTIVARPTSHLCKGRFSTCRKFLKSYYLGQEYQGGPIDLIENIDRYIKLDETTNLTESAVMSGDITFTEQPLTLIQQSLLQEQEDFQIHMDC